MSEQQHKTTYSYSPTQILDQLIEALNKSQLLDDSTLGKELKNHIKYLSETDRTWQTPSTVLTVNIEEKQ